MNSEFLISSAERVENVSMAVAITVIVLLFLAFAWLFYLYYRYFRKSVDYEIEDRYILRDMVRRDRVYFAEAGEEYDHGSKEAPSFSEFRSRGLAKARIWKVVGNSVLILFYLAFAALMIAAISIRAQGDAFAIGDRSYLVIQTGSMEEKNTSNDYLFDEKLDNQIPAYSLIELKTVSIDEMTIYDIYAFKADGAIYVHRLISMGSNGDGEMRYAFRGDSNAISGSYEVSVPFDDIIGVYTGWNNFELGLFVNYAKSYIGIITISFALILIGFYDILDAAIGKRIKLREDDLAVRVDQDIKQRFANRSGFPYTLYLDRKLKPQEIIPPFLMEPKEPKQQ